MNKVINIIVIPLTLFGMIGLGELLLHSAEDRSLFETWQLMSDLGHISLIVLAVVTILYSIWVAIRDAI